MVFTYEIACWSRVLQGTKKYSSKGGQVKECKLFEGTIAEKY